MEFAKGFPEQRRALIDCLVGDVIKDMSAFTTALAQMTPPPPPLGSNLSKSSAPVPVGAARSGELANP
jgi:hypothetical protein